MLLRFLTLFFVIIGYCICEQLPLFNNNDLIGFIKLKDNGDTVNIDFDLKQNDLKFIILDGAIPFSSNINQCKKFKNSATVVKAESALNKFDTPKEDIIGNTIVITKDGNPIACSTVILDTTSLYEVTVSDDELNGKIHLFDLKNNVKIVPVLSFSDVKKEIFVELVDDCTKTAEQNYTLNSFSTITADISNSSFVDNIQNSYLKLSNENVQISCKKILPSINLSANGMNVNIEQKNAFIAPRVTKDFKNLSIGDTCNKTSDKVIIHNGYAPKLILFGSESKVFKAINVDGKCGAILPKFGFPILTSSFLHPIIGKLYLIQTSKDYFVVSDLQSIFDANETPATVNFSNASTLSSSCFNFSSSYMVKDSIPIRGFSTKNSNNNIQSFSRFIEFDSIKSVQVDLGWIKACANLTLLSLGVIKGNAILRTHNIAASRNLANIEIFEYPLFNETEIIASKNEEDSKNDVIKNLYFYKRPIDMTISTAPPCSESTVGAKTQVQWEKELIKKLGSNKSERLFLKTKALTGSTKNILGLTVMADFDENVVGCGTIELKGQKKIAMALFNETGVNGFLKMTQISSSLAMPTEVSYYIEAEEHDESLQASSHESPTKLFWEIVAMNGGICQSARPFDPFKVQDHNKCQEDIDFCPVGQVVNRSELLTQNSKQHFILHGFSIVDGAAASNLYVRLYTKENQTICSKINLYEKIYIHWISESNSSLALLKDKLSQHLSLSSYQIGVDYTRAFKGNRCSIFTVMLLLTPEEKIEFNKKFDITNQKLFNEKEINCSTSDDDEILSSNSHAFTVFYHVFSILLYYCYTHIFYV